jgi:hypothetical protein
MRDRRWCESSVIALVGVLVGVLLGCSSTEGSPVVLRTPAGDAETDAPGLSDGSYGESACRLCVTSACTGPLADCASDPDCAAYLACFDACGLQKNGNVNASCEARCPVGSTSSGMQGELDLSECRTSGAGALCVACGTAVSLSESPILRQECPPVDASDTCERCEDENCCETSAACGAACQGFRKCRDDGGDYLDCKSQFPSGFLPAEENNACHVIFCARSDACPTITNPCFQCIYQYCAPEYAKLVGSVAGALAWECFAAGDSLTACTASSSEATEAGEPLETCLVNDCMGCIF